MMLKCVLLEIPWVALGLFLSKVAYKCAAYTRGCNAIGSEIFVFPVIVAIGWYVSCAVVDHFYPETEDEELYEDYEEEYEYGEQL